MFTCRVKVIIQWKELYSLTRFKPCSIRYLKYLLDTCKYLIPGLFNVIHVKAISTMNIKCTNSMPLDSVCQHFTVGNNMHLSSKQCYIPFFCFIGVANKKVKTHWQRRHLRNKERPIWELKSTLCVTKLTLKS